MSEFDLLFVTKLETLELILQKCNILANISGIIVSYIIPLMSSLYCEHYANTNIVFFLS